jgi:hypothetical protein
MMSVARRDIVFMHIPKTAGTSLRIAMEKTLRGRLILHDYGNVRETTPELYRLVYEDRRLSEFRTRFNHRRRGILLTGHFPGFGGTCGASRYWDFFNAESFVTFLRHPVDRVISEFAHAVNLQGWTSGFEEFVASRRGRQCCRIISTLLADVDLESFGFIGFTEEFPESFAALAKYAGGDLPWIESNVGNYGTINQEVVNGDRYRSMLLDLCQEDIALYERLRRERSGRYVALGADASVAREYIGRVGVADGRATGWLCNRAREFIAWVDVVHEGQVVNSAPADRYRKGVKDAGHSRTGICGFEIDLQSIAGVGLGTKLTFRAHGSDYELVGSPVLL